MNWKRLCLPLLLCALASGCAKKDAASQRAADSVAAVVKERAMNEANALATIDAIMAADSATASVMVKKSAREEVRRFAAMLMTDSHDLRAATLETEHQTGITPAFSAGDPISGEASMTLSLINGGTPNADGLFLSGVVARDRALGAGLLRESARTENSELKKLFGKVATASQRHVAAIAALEEKKK